MHLKDLQCVEFSIYTGLQLSDITETENWFNIERLEISKKFGAKKIFLA